MHSEDLDQTAQKSSLGTFWMAKNAKFLHSLGAHVRNIPLDTCAQRRFRSDCAFAQSDQNPHRTQFGWPRMQIFFIRLVRISEGMDSHFETRFYC